MSVSNETRMAISQGLYDAINKHLFWITETWLNELLNDCEEAVYNALESEC